MPAGELLSHPLVVTVIGVAAAAATAAAFRAVALLGSIAAQLGAIDRRVGRLETLADRFMAPPAGGPPLSLTG